VNDLASTQGEVVVNLDLLGMGWGLHHSAITDHEEYDRFLGHIGTRANALLASERSVFGAFPKFAVRVRRNSVLQEGDKRKTYIARRAAALESQAQPIEKLRVNRPVTMFGFDLVATPEPARILKWFQPTKAELNIQGDRLLLHFHEHSRTEQPVPKLGKHELNGEEVSRVLQKMYEQNSEGAPLRFIGESPIALMLEVLSHNPRPNPRNRTPQ
jgi:hypothetical protein